LTLINKVRCSAALREKTDDKFLTSCYVLLSSDRVSCPRHFSFMRAHYAQGIGYLFRRLGNSNMDDYQEELLEYQAFELDPLEPAEDATEL